MKFHPGRADVASALSPARFQAAKNPPLGQGGFPELVLLCPDDVGRLKALGALEQIELHGLTFV